MNDALNNLPKTLLDENGGGFGFVCIWRAGQKEDSARKCTVGGFLSIEENQSGSWFIDGGWGGPPGPVMVRWDYDSKKWLNKGFPPHDKMAAV